ncbi:hypothetical protein C2W59_03078 [Bacillus pumilus]|nr:hypothetical protein C2W58_03555 [Bacillus pumilus]RAP22939.1 hypothetical protein C2W59_03078 [Bacillus pumilus]
MKNVRFSYSYCVLKMKLVFGTIDKEIKKMKEILFNELFPAA